MAKICYTDKNFRGDSLDIINKAETICQEYEKDGYIITLRQLYYQFVSRGFLANTVENYKRLGNIINDARLAGLLDWKWLEDRTRNLQGNTHWTSPADILEAVASQFRLDKWTTQPYHVEVWVEKEALAAVIERAARDLDVSFFACKGYVSQSEMHEAALRFKRYYRNRGQPTRVIHLGDHDPSGIDMTRDVCDRMEIFGVPEFKIDRIALNMDQVRRYNPPPNPAKTTDARFAGYAKEYGLESWELDALNPRILGDLIRKAVLKYRDPDKYKKVEDKEALMKKSLEACSERWPDVADYLGYASAAEGVEDADMDDEGDGTSCGFPECASEGESKNVYADGVCETCFNRGWRQCADCKDYAQSHFTHEGKDGELRCEECNDKYEEADPSTED